jgi:hypothetical protein
MKSIFGKDRRNFDNGSSGVKIGKTEAEDPLWDLFSTGFEEF